MSEMILDQTSQAELNSLVEERFGHEPEWSLKRRREAVHALLNLDWPRLERTPLKKRKLDQIALFQAVPAPGVRPTPAPDGWAEIWLDNNQVVSVSVPDTLSQKGVRLEALNEALGDPEVEAQLGRLLGQDEDKVAALNGALWQGGVFLRVPAHLREVVQVSIRCHATAEAQAVFSKNLIICGSKSHVVVTQRLETDDGGMKTMLSENTEIIVEDGGRVEFGAIQQCAPTVEGFIHRSGALGHDAVLNWNIGEFGSGLVVSDHVSHLNEPGASTASTTVFFGAGSQHQDYSAKSYHHAPHTTSNMVARGVMKNKARSVFTGLTQIEAGAKGSDGRQKEQTLMLSGDARADAIPSLIIDERDVFAAHAASAGPIDRAAVFYLTSRGLSEAEAERMIVHGFLAPVIDSIALPELRDEAWDAVERKIRA